MKCDPGTPRVCCGNQNSLSGRRSLGTQRWSLKEKYRSPDEEEKALRGDNSAHKGPTGQGEMGQDSDKWLGLGEAANEG